MGVLLIASMGAFSAQIASLNLTKTSRETNIAMSDLQAAMERLLAEPAAELPQPDSPYEQGVPIEAFTDRNLRDEQMVATYPGYVAGGDTPDPLTIQLTVTWADFQGRPRQLQLSSMRTQ